MSTPADQRWLVDEAKSKRLDHLRETAPSPLYIGRAVWALATDELVADLTIRVIKESITPYGAYYRLVPLLERIALAALE